MSKSFARRTAMARPIPFEAPVTTASGFFIRRGSFL
jgi:hypothetical protein